MSKRFVYFLLVVLLLVNTVFVYADSSIEEDKKDLENLEDKIQEGVKQKKELEEGIEEVSSEIKQLDVKIDQTEDSLYKVENELIELEDQIETTEQELREAEDNIEDKKDTFSTRLKIMYMNRSVGYFEVLFAASDLKDLLTRLDMFKMIIEHDVNLLRYMKEQRDIVEEKKDTLNQKYASVQDTKEQISSKKNELELANRNMQSLKKRLENDKKELEKQLDDLNALAKKLEKEIKRKQLEMQYAGGKMQWPVKGYYYVTSPFGWRIHPVFGTKKMHTGIDLRAPYGTSILAANSGKVQFAGRLGGYGNAVIIDHGGGITTLYAHNSRLLVKEGQWVKRGQVIAKAGSTGYSTGPHLHFEVRKNGKYVDPYPWIKNK